MKKAWYELVTAYVKVLTNIYLEVLRKTKKTLLGIAYFPAEFRSTSAQHSITTFSGIGYCRLCSPVNVGPLLLL
jgi:hypothetical protein